MKHFMLSLVIAMAATAAMAQSGQGLADTQRLIGYTVSDDIDISGACFGTAGTYTIGAILPPQMIASYEGCHIVGIRFALSQSIGRTSAFVHLVSNGSLQQLFSQKQRTYEGWNTIMFNGNGYELQGDETLFFGYDYVETAEMVAADEGAICTVGEDTDGAFYLYGNYGQGEGFYGISEVGRLCVQLILDVSNLPRKDLDMTYFDMGKKYKQPGETIDLFTTFANVGRDSVFQYRMGYQIDDGEPVYQERRDTLVCGETQSWEVEFPLPDDISTGMHSLKAFVSQIEGQPLQKIKNDTLQGNFAIYRQNLHRQKIYFEVYADQRTPYLPMLDRALEQIKTDCPQVALAKAFNVENTLGIDEADYLHQLYAYDYPTFTFNRAYFPGEPYIAYDMNYYLPQIPTEMIAGILYDMVLQDYEDPTFATIDLTADFQPDTRQLTVNVSGEALPEAEAIYGQLALTLLLTEDGVKEQQAVYNAITGRTNTDRNYVHNNVLRQFITPAIGQPFTISDGNYQETFTLNLDETFKAENIQVIALLTKAAEEVNDDNVLDMDIINANSTTLTIHEPTAIQSVVNTQVSEYYSLDGMRLDPKDLRPGIVIMRKADGTTRKVRVSR